MPLDRGVKLGQYEIIEPVGAGGMGEVYRARDGKLGRDVAIKVLPDELARDRERLDRFEREARLLAQVNHPNIATLHGLEDHDGQQFLVMELVEGETLAERIAQGRLPIDEALPLFVQIAEGLEAAHEKGIVHRDLKPANIKIGPDGKPKILDFGLAKAFADTEPVVDSSQSPTLTKGTALGVIMGTASYMSPEQARGRPLDRRTDIWAFGCCLYEALTARKAFEGETVTDTLAKIVEREPDWSALPERTPRSTRLLLERCLRKKREERLRSAGDIALGMREGAGDADAPRGERERTWAVSIAALVLTAALGALVSYALRGDATEAPEPYHWTVPLPPGGSVRGEVIALSPDGRELVAAVAIEGRSQLWRKASDSGMLEPIPGTEDGFSPFFSPDGAWIGFFANEWLQKIPVGGGRPTALCESRRTPRQQQAVWGADGTIVYRLGSGVGLARCSADGGEPVALTEYGRLGESSHTAPSLLPDGSVLFGVGGGAAEPSLALLTSDSSEWRPVPVGTRTARFSKSGHLVYEWHGRLLAAAFDPSQPERVGRDIIMIDGVYDASSSTAAFTLSDNGTLAYLPGSAVLDQLVWVDRKGQVVGELGEPGLHMYPRISPRADRVLVSLAPSVDAPRDIWLYDIVRGSRTRLTFDRNAFTGEWSPDAARIALLSFPADEDARGVYVIPADGNGAPELLDDSGSDPTSWSPDGSTLLMRGGASQRWGDVWAVDVAGERETRPLLKESFNEYVAIFSPDGRWIAYTSNESGRSEVYARPYPGLGPKYSVSTRGGAEPVWSKDGREIFFRNGDAMMVADVLLEPEFQVGVPRELFEDNFRPAPADNSNYDVSADGERFLMIRPTGEPPHEIHVIVNWTRELERLVPPLD